MERTRSVYPELARRLDKGESLALATIVETQGSTPQVPGASALFGAGGLIAGTLGGGILEGEAARRAASCLGSARSQFFRFGLRGRDLADEEPVCGGEAAIVIDGSPGILLPAIRAMRESLALRRRGVLVTLVSADPSGEARLSRTWVEEGIGPESPAGAGLVPAAEDLRQAVSSGEPAAIWISASREGPNQLYFLEPLAPLPRLLIAGAGHIGAALARLGAALDFEVTVIDDRPEFAAAGRLPAAAVFCRARPGAALRDLPIDGDTYVVIVTPGHRDDAEALRACVRSRAAYIGMIGSRSKAGLARERFLREGWAFAEEFDRVHTPIGLPIGSRTVEEIAVSIAAELVQVRSRRSREAGGAAR